MSVWEDVSFSHRDGVQLMGGLVPLCIEFTNLDTSQGPETSKRGHRDYLARLMSFADALDNNTNPHLHQKHPQNIRLVYTVIISHTHYLYILLSYHLSNHFTDSP